MSTATVSAKSSASKSKKSSPKKVPKKVPDSAFDEMTLSANIAVGETLKEYGVEDPKYFMGLDIGLKKDPSALVICRVEPCSLQKESPLIHVDYIDTLPSPQNPEGVVDWVGQSLKKFNISAIAMDAYYAEVIRPILIAGGMKPEAVVVVSPTDAPLRTVLIRSGLRVPQKDCVACELPDAMFFSLNGRPWKLVKELAHRSKDGSMDLADALSRAVWLALEYLKSPVAGDDLKETPKESLKDPQIEITANIKSFESELNETEADKAQILDALFDPAMTPHKAKANMTEQEIKNLYEEILLTGSTEMGIEKELVEQGAQTFRDHC